MVDRTMLQFDYDEAHGHVATAVLGRRDGAAGAGRADLDEEWRRDRSGIDEQPRDRHAGPVGADQRRLAAARNESRQAKAKYHRGCVKTR